MSFYKPQEKTLEEKLRSTIENIKKDFDAETKISLYRISDGLEANVNAYDPGWSASIIKVPVMIATLQEIDRKKLSLTTFLKTNHKYMLETYDFTSMLPNNQEISVDDLIFYMLVESDNEATNILVDKIGIETLNNSIKNLGLEKTMFSHLLCPNVPKITNEFNPDGSNLTCPADMVKIMRHIYDENFSELSNNVRIMAQTFFTYTKPSYLNKGIFRDKIIRAKVGFISDIKAGNDQHEVGIIDNDLIVCIMLNKIKNQYSYYSYKNPESKEFGGETAGTEATDNKIPSAKIEKKNKKTRWQILNDLLDPISEDYFNEIVSSYSSYHDYYPYQKSSSSEVFYNLMETISDKLYPVEKEKMWGRNRDIYEKSQQEVPYKIEGIAAGIAKTSTFQLKNPPAPSNVVYAEYEELPNSAEAIDGEYEQIKQEVNNVKKELEQAQRGYNVSDEDLPEGAD
ncbi:MAG: serine hydrolase [Nanoarchaeota archaeon]|nr:serine hydrolase [Nanoarchaeota archaeon]